MSKINIESIQEELQSKKWRLISEAYKNLDEILEYECPEGHRVFAPWRKMRTSPTCSVCANNTYKNIEQKVVKKKSGTKRILALDQATRISGWSIYDGKDLINYGIYAAPEGEEIERFDSVKNWLVSMITMWKPDHIALEGIQYQQNFGVTTFETLARLQGILMECCYENHIPFIICPTNTWRHHSGVKGTARADRKKSARLIIKNMYDVSVSEDEADSILIGRYVADTINKDQIIDWE